MPAKNQAEGRTGDGPVLSRREALARLGLGATAAYVAPVLLELSGVARARGGGEGGEGGEGGGSGAGGPGGGSGPGGNSGPGGSGADSSGSDSSGSDSSESSSDDSSGDDSSGKDSDSASGESGHDGFAGGLGRSGPDLSKGEEAGAIASGWQ